MGAPGPLSNVSSDITDWLPLLGSIVQALRGIAEDRPPADDADAPQLGGEAPSDETGR